MDNLDLNSIINKNSVQTEVLDNIQPYTFIEFCSKSNLDNTNKNFLSLYKEYLVEWAKVKNNNGIDINLKELIHNQIITLLKIITVSYSTYNEQLFLSKLNWDFKNITDLTERKAAKNSIYSALPIFVSRLKDIATFYNNKRNEATFTVDRYKVRGTKLSIEKIIFEKILNYLFNNDPASITYVQKYMNISLDTYVDTYTEYFDIDRTEASTDDYNDIDKSIYFELETVLSEMLYDGYVFLNEIPLIAQLSVDLTGDCVGDKAVLKEELLNDILKCQVTNEEKVALKKKLYQKYLGVDFYYLYINADGTIQQDIFIKADNPSNNLLNQQTVDTPSNFKKQIELLKNIGLFFKPGKDGLLRLNTVNYSYEIDLDKIETEKVYIFPDPKVYGNVSFNRQKDYPYVIEYSFTDYCKNLSFGWANNDPLVRSDDQAIFAYYSRSQDYNKVDPNNSVKRYFEDLYNKGYISKLKTDLYGNYFGLFKEESIVKEKADKSGYYLSYSGKFDRRWNIDYTNRPIIDDSSEYKLIDGGTFNKAEPIQKSADHNGYNSNDHNYDYFFEGGLSSFNDNKYTRAFIGQDNKIIGNGTFNIDINKNINSTAELNGIEFYNDINNFLNVEESNIQKFFNINNKFLSEQLETKFNPSYSSSSKTTSLEIANKPGKIYVAINGTNNTEPIENICEWLSDEEYTDFITNTIDIDILENTLIITASKANAIIILFDQIEFDQNTNKYIRKNKDINPIIFDITDYNINESNNRKYAGNWQKLKDKDSEIFEGNTNVYNKISPIFYVESLHKCYISMMDINISSKEINNEEVKFVTCYPNIYEIDLANFICKKYIFEENNNKNEQRDESFKIPSTLYPIGTVNLKKVNKPYLTYSIDSNMFMLVYILYNTSSYPFIYKHYFKLQDSANIYNGLIDDASLDSSVYVSESSSITAIITPGDPELTLSLNFDSNDILS